MSENTTHTTYKTGTTLPAKEICDLARSYGITTLIDGAHNPGMFNLKFDAMGRPRIQDYIFSMSAYTKMRLQEVFGGTNLFKQIDGLMDAMADLHERMVNGLPANLLKSTQRGHDDDDGCRDD